MPSTYTVSNNLEKIAFNEQNNSWGQTLDNNLDLIDQVTDGVATIAMTGSKTITMLQGVSCEARCRYLTLSGTLTAQASLTITPAIKKIYWVYNGTNQQVIISNGGPNTTAVDPGKTVPVVLFGDGNVFALMSSTTFFGTVSVNNINAISMGGGFTNFTPSQFPAPNPNLSLTFSECGWFSFGGLAYVQLTGTIVYTAAVDSFYMSIPAAAVNQQALAAAVNGPTVVNANSWTSGGALALGVNSSQVHLNQAYTFSINGWIRLA